MSLVSIGVSLSSGCRPEQAVSRAFGQGLDVLLGVNIRAVVRVGRCPAQHGLRVGGLPLFATKVGVACQNRFTHLRREHDRIAGLAIHFGLNDLHKVRPHVVHSDQVPNVLRIDEWLVCQSNQHRVNVGRQRLQPELE